MELRQPLPLKRGRDCGGSQRDGGGEHEAVRLPYSSAALVLETELALGSDLDDSFLESVSFERQLKKSSRMQNAVSLYPKNIVVMKEHRCYRNLKAIVRDILESQQQTMLISQKTLSKDGAAPACSFEETRGKRQRLQLLDFGRIVFRRRKMFLQP